MSGADEKLINLNVLEMSADEPMPGCPNECEEHETMRRAARNSASGSVQFVCKKQNRLIRLTVGEVEKG